MKELKSWGDLARNYSMVLFNNMINLDDREVFIEWSDNHQCEAQEAQDHLDFCKIENCKKCKEIKEEFGENPECNCEVFQWFLIAVNDFDVEYLNKEFNLDIFYSDFLEAYVLPVYHFGTGWDIVGLKGGYIDETN